MRYNIWTNIGELTEFIAKLARAAKNFFIKIDRFIKSMLAYRIEVLEKMKKKILGKKQPNKNIM